MKLSKRKYFRLLAFIVFPLLMFGCASEKVKTPTVAEEVKLNLGAVLKSEEGTYKLYNYENGKYEKMKDNNVILSYDKSSSNYICLDNGKTYIVSNNNKFEIKDENYSELKLSKGGKYVSYFIDDNGLKLKIIDTNKNNQIEIKSSVSISGTLYDWYNANTLVYYGVSDDGINGLFTYDINENKEELLYRIKEGYLAFLKGTDDNVVFVQLTLENKKELMMINKKTKDVKLLSQNIEDLTDIVVADDKLYFTGKVFSNTNSLYLIEDNKEKRLVFDFPAVVKVEKGLQVDEKGNILFAGASNISDREEQIYTYSKDGSISIVSKNSTDYSFIDYKS